jgi:subtilase family serine protease
MKSLYRRFASRNLLSAISLAVLSLLLVAAAAAQTLHLSQTPAAVLNGRAVLQGHYEPSQMLRLAIALAPPHPAEEQQFLEDVQNKQSPLFHQFLSAGEWNSRFGPSAEDEQAVADWAAGQGLTVTHRYANRLIVDVEAQAGVIENAFHVTINRYRMTDDNGPEEYTVFSNDRDPQLPSRLTEIVASVQGLN